jgi:glutaminyl-peptide cyclotransferase
MSAAPEVVTRVWQKAADLGYSKYFQPKGYGFAVTDDHVPFIQKGFRVIDVLDLDYGPMSPSGQALPNYHHTLQDTMEHISVKSFQVVGDVALSLLMDG